MTARRRAYPHLRSAHSAGYCDLNEFVRPNLHRFSCGRSDQGTIGAVNISEVRAALRVLQTQHQAVETWRNCASWRGMAAAASCPRVYHQKLPTTVDDRRVDAPFVLGV